MNEIHPPPTVHVVDDEASWRLSTERLLTAAGYRVVTYESAERFLAGIATDGPGCILLDVYMPGLTGLQLQQRLAVAKHRLPIVFLSGRADVPLAVEAVKAGADDVLTKPVDREVLLGVVARAIDRDREARDGGARLELLRDRIAQLTPMERKVFDLVVRGKLNKQVAAELGITERTVKWHRHNIMPKLQVDSLAALVSLAEQLGLLASHDRS